MFTHNINAPARILEDLDLQERILRSRARLFSKEKSDVNVEDILTLLAFKVGNEKYSLEIDYISKIIILKNLTPLPGTPLSLIGIINVHGNIVPVFDIKNIFEIKVTSPERSKSQHVVVVSIEDAIYGILFDEILGVENVPKNDIQETLPTLTGLRSTFTKGVTNSQMVILDPNKFATDKQLVKT